LDDATVVHDRDKVRQIEGLLAIMSHHDRGGFLLPQDARHVSTQRMAQHAIQGAEGLIQEEHIRRRGKSSRESDALSLTAGELTGGAVGKPLEPDQGGKLLNTFRSPTTFGQRETDVVSHAEVGEE